MTNEEILKAAIEKASSNGFHILSAVQAFDPGMVGLDWRQTAYDPYDLVVIINGELRLHLNDVIFSHDFAKAFWGEEKRPTFDDCKECGTRTMTDVGTYGWGHHLQQLVLEDDPIQYLERFL
jgi:hypothetical protein